MSVKQGEHPKVVATLKIDPELYKAAKDLCWEKRITFSSKAEALVREWVSKEQKKKKS